MKLYWTVLIASLVALPAWGEVQAVGATGFSLELSAVTRATPAQAFRAFTEIHKWWDPSHSYSGDADNLSLVLEPGGAFLERLPDGGFVEHLQLVYLDPGKEVRLLGGLGPLQGMGLHGALTFQFKPAAGGCQIIMLYNVSGFSGQGLETLAPVVDTVQKGQLERLATYADSIDRAGAAH
jgi:hypothetical protein